MNSFYFYSIVPIPKPCWYPINTTLYQQGLVQIQTVPKPLMLFTSTLPPLHSLVHSALKTDCEYFHGLSASQVFGLLIPTNFAPVRFTASTKRNFGTFHVSQHPNEAYADRSVSWTISSAEISSRNRVSTTPKLCLRWDSLVSRSLICCRHLFRVRPIYSPMAFLTLRTETSETSRLCLINFQWMGSFVGSISWAWRNSTLLYSRGIANRFEGFMTIRTSSTPRLSILWMILVDFSAFYCARATSAMSPILLPVFESWGRCLCRSSGWKQGTCSQRPFLRSLCTTGCQLTCWYKPWAFPILVDGAPWRSSKLSDKIEPWTASHGQRHWIRFIYSRSLFSFIFITLYRCFENVLLRRVCLVYMVEACFTRPHPHKMHILYIICLNDVNQLNSYRHQSAFDGITHLSLWRKLW